MIKKSRFLAVSTLMTCVILAMTTVIVSATDYIYQTNINGKNVVSVYDDETILSPGDEITCDAEALEVVYYEEYFDTETIWKTETFIKDSLPITTQILDTPSAVPGYKDSAWQIVGIGHGIDGETGKYTETVCFARDAVDYTVVYYDDSEWLYEETISLDTAENYFNGYAEKEGYVLKGWDTNPAGKTVVYKPNEILTSEILLSISDTLNLYAVWDKAPAAEPPTVDEDDDSSAKPSPTDASPSTGDSTPVTTLILLMIFSSLGMVAAVSRKNNPA